MRVVARQADATFDGYGWQPEVLAALEQQHLVAWSEQVRRRNRFGAELRRFLAAQPQTDVCFLHGRAVLNLDHLCHQLERLVPVNALQRRLDGPESVTELFRGETLAPGIRVPRSRYWIWSDADVLLKADPVLFGRVVDCMLGVAAECEYGLEGGVTIQRTVFVGGPLLEDYARDRRGQFRCWAADDDAEPFWQLVSGLERPPVMTRPVDLLMRPARRVGA